MPIRLLLITMALVMTLSCTPRAALQDDPVADAPDQATCCTLVLIKTGSMSGKLSEADNGKAFAGHFENMSRLANARQLLIAGPYGEQRHDPQLRGLFVLATADRAEAERWASTDPTTIAGVFTLEFHALATEAPLLAALDRYLADAEKQKAEGTEEKPGDKMRSYVLLTADDGIRTERELAALKHRAGGVFLLGRLDGNRAFAILDAEAADVAKTRFAQPLANIGTYTLDDWYASKQIESLVD